jgi:hypothetical protein
MIHTLLKSPIFQSSNLFLLFSNPTLTPNRSSSSSDLQERNIPINSHTKCAKSFTINITVTQHIQHSSDPSYHADYHGFPAYSTKRSKSYAKNSTTHVQNAHGDLSTYQQGLVYQQHTPSFLLHLLFQSFTSKLQCQLESSSSPFPRS